MKAKHHIELNLYNLATLPTKTSESKHPERCHESLFQSWALLQTLESLLDQGTPPHVALGIIDSIRSLSAALRCANEPNPDEGT